jgi:hypothetical protein
VNGFFQTITFLTLIFSCILSLFHVKGINVYWVQKMFRVKRNAHGFNFLKSFIGVEKFTEFKNVHDFENMEYLNI